MPSLLKSGGPLGLVVSPPIRQQRQQVEDADGVPESPIMNVRLEDLHHSLNVIFAAELHDRNLFSGNFEVGGDHDSHKIAVCELERNVAHRERFRTAIHGDG